MDESVNKNLKNSTFWLRRILRLEFCVPIAATFWPNVWICSTSFCVRSTCAGSTGRIISSSNAHFILGHGSAVADDLDTSFGDDQSKSNHVRFRLVKLAGVREDVINIKFNGRGSSVKTIVQSSFDGGEIHRVLHNGSGRGIPISFDWRNKRFRSGPIHQLAQSGRDSITLRFEIPSPIFRSRSIQKNLGLQHLEAITFFCRPPVFNNGFQIPRAQALIFLIWIAVPSDIKLGYYSY